MSLNISKGNMYEFITHTWNPLGGACSHNCSYCSTQKLMRYPAIEQKYSGYARLIEKEFKTNLGTGNFIFVAAQNDLFASNISFKMIVKTMEYCKQFNNSYMFQSKHPGNMVYNEPIMPIDTVLCTTIESNRWFPVIMGNSPLPEHRAEWFSESQRIKYLTIEPILDFDLLEFTEMIKMINPIQVNIGADSGKNGLPEPPKEKVISLISELQKFTTVYQKYNLKRLIS